MSSTASPTLAKKLGLAGDIVFTVVGAPAGFVDSLGDTGEAVWQRNLLAPIDVVVGFVKDRAQLEQRFPDWADAARPAGAVWVAWPKASGPVRSDLTDRVVRDWVLAQGWVDNKVCAIDDTWSALRFTMRADTRPPWKR